MKRCQKKQCLLGSFAKLKDREVSHFVTDCHRPLGNPCHGLRKDCKSVANLQISMSHDVTQGLGPAVRTDHKMVPVLFSCVHVGVCHRLTCSD